ncbi:hypothetical protein GOODEAATRI_007921, partial [Goodea atripinnis]
RHADCLKELNGLITESPTAELYVFRARVHKVMNQVTKLQGGPQPKVLQIFFCSNFTRQVFLFCQTSCCVRDVKSALALDPTCREAEALLLQLKEASEEARQQAVLRMLSDNLQEALCLINTALESSPEDGRLYLFRGILYRRLKEFTSAIEDLVQAAELSELEGKKVRKVKEETNESCSVQEEVQLQLALTYNDFAVQCFSRGLYAEATLLLNKAIKEEKNLAGLYLNRGGRDDMAVHHGMLRLSAKQEEPEKLDHNSPSLQFNQKQRFQDAVDMFSLAIKYNPTVSQYYENRSKALRRVQNLRGAREDFLCMLILDPNNEEAPPMLMNLFPGSTMSEVMSSTKGRALRAELTETIQAWNSSSDPQRLAAPTLDRHQKTISSPLPLTD